MASEKIKFYKHMHKPGFIYPRKTSRMAREAIVDNLNMIYNEYVELSKTQEYSDTKINMLCNPQEWMPDFCTGADNHEWDLVIGNKGYDWLEKAYLSGGVSEKRLAIIMLYAFDDVKKMESRTPIDPIVSVYSANNAFTRQANLYMKEHPDTKNVILKLNRVGDNIELYDCFDMAIHLSGFKKIRYIEEINDYANNCKVFLVNNQLDTSYIQPALSIFTKEVFTNRKIYTNFKPQTFILTKDDESESIYMEYEY